MFVLLKLKAYGQAVGGDGFCQFAAGKGRVIGGHVLEHVAD